MSSQNIQQIIDSFVGTRVLVIGDIMLDRYLRGRAERQSPEADVPILDHEETSTKLGGAANVAMNFRSLGCKVMLFSITGEDQAAKEVENLLNEGKIEHLLVACDDRPTTIKTRIIAGERHLLRVDFEKTDYPASKMENILIDRAIETIDTFQPELIVFQDYNKGLLTENLIRKVILAGRASGSFICVDPKEDNFWAYTDVDVFKPNLRELESALSTRLPDLESRNCGAGETLHRLNAKYIALTLGSDGILLCNAISSHYETSTPIEVIDVCGAGDAVLSIISLLLWRGESMELVAQAANRAGGRVCEYSGVKIIDKEMFT